MRVVIALVIAAGCGSSDPPSPDAAGAVDGPPLAMRWLPMVTGATWTYQVTPLGLPPEQKTQTVMQVEEVPGKPGQLAYFVVTEKIDGRTESWQEDRGNMIVRHREISYDLAGTMNGVESYAPYKMRIDETAEHTAAAADFVLTYEETIGALAPVAKSEHWWVEAVDESVTVPAGTFPCLRLRRMGTEVGQSDKRFWFARGVGKIREEGDQVEELMSYTLP